MKHLPYEAGIPTRQISAENPTGEKGGACRWVPLFTQRYTIEVANLGQEDARYFLVVD